MTEITIEALQEQIYALEERVMALETATEPANLAAAVSKRMRSLGS